MRNVITKIIIIIVSRINVSLPRTQACPNLPRVFFNSIRKIELIPDNFDVQNIAKNYNEKKSFITAYGARKYDTNFKTEPSVDSKIELISK